MVFKPVEDRVSARWRGGGGKEEEEGEEEEEGCF
jgi:hypothetical protein